MFDSKFFLLLESRLCLNGHIIFNAYGLPMHLAAFQGASPQARLASRLHNYWGNVRCLPHRRNATLIVGGRELPSIVPVIDNELILGDRAALSLLQLRLLHLESISVVDREWGTETGSFSVIDAEMRKRWTTLLPELSLIFHRDFHAPRDLLGVLNYPELCVYTQELLSQSRSPLEPMLPILVAGEMNNRVLDTRWLPRWTIATMQSNTGSKYQKFISIALPQALSVLNNSRNKDPDMLTRFTEALQPFSGAS